MDRWRPSTAYLYLHLFLHFNLHARALRRKDRHPPSLHPSLPLPPAFCAWERVSFYVEGMETFWKLALQAHDGAVASAAASLLIELHAGIAPSTPITPASSSTSPLPPSVTDGVCRGALAQRCLDALADSWILQEGGEGGREDVGEYGGEEGGEEGRRREASRVMRIVQIFKGLVRRCAERDALLPFTSFPPSSDSARRTGKGKEEGGEGGGGEEEEERIDLVVQVGEKGGKHVEMSGLKVETRVGTVREHVASEIQIPVEGIQLYVMSREGKEGPGPREEVETPVMGREGGRCPTPLGLTEFDLLECDGATLEDEGLHLLRPSHRPILLLAICDECPSSPSPSLPPFRRYAFDLLAPRSYFLLPTAAVLT